MRVCSQVRAGQEHKMAVVCHEERIGGLLGFKAFSRSLEWCHDDITRPETDSWTVRFQQSASASPKRVSCKPSLKTVLSGTAYSITIAYSRIKSAPFKHPVAPIKGRSASSATDIYHRTDEGMHCQVHMGHYVYDSL